MACLKLDAETWREISRLWNELHTWPIADVDGAICHGIEGLCELTGARHGAAVLAIRVVEDPSDPLQGWRPGPLIHHGAVHRIPESVVDEWARHEPNYTEDPLTQAAVRGCGASRVIHRSVVPDDRWSGSSSEALMKMLGVSDRMIGAHASHPDLEVHFVLDRWPEDGDFDEADQLVLREAIEGMGELCRRYTLSYGLVEAIKPLPPRQRQTLLNLLTGLSEKEIADRMGLTPRSLHQYVVSIYRQFGVRSRAELMAWWMRSHDVALP